MAEEVVRTGGEVGCARGQVRVSDEEEVFWSGFVLVVDGMVEDEDEEEEVS